jgi:hypothetical protein
LFGNLVWLRQFGSPGFDGILAATTDRAGAVYVAGVAGGTTSARDTAGLLAKYDSSGNQLWVRRFGAAGTTTAAFGVTVDPDGELYVVGTVSDIARHDSFLTKFSVSGEQRWSRVTSNGPASDFIRVAADDRGHVYVAGLTITDPNAGDDVVVAQYDGSGNQVWARQFGTASNDLPTGIATDPLGDVYVVGEQDGYDLEASFLARYDAAGNQQWVRSFSGQSFPPLAMSVAADSAGHAFVAGFTPGSFAGQTSVGGFDAFALEYDRGGAQLWVRQFGSPESEDVRGVAVDDGGNVYVAGHTSGAFPGQTFLGGADAFLVRLLVAPVRVEERIAEIRRILAAMPISAGFVRALDHILAAAERSALRGHIDAACGQLGATAHKVSAQDRKKLTHDQAVLLGDLIDDARTQVCRPRE